MNECEQILEEYGFEAVSDSDDENQSLPTGRFCQSKTPPMPKRDSSVVSARSVPKDTLLGMSFEEMSEFMENMKKQKGDDYQGPKQYTI